MNKEKAAVQETLELLEKEINEKDKLVVFYRSKIKENEEKIKANEKYFKERNIELNKKKEALEAKLNSLLTTHNIVSKCKELIESEEEND